MSNTDSFIDEVNDEVRRDRLFAMIRRYGWIAVLLIVVIVGGAAWHEYNKAEARAKAERLGDAVLDALAQNDLGERAAGLANISGDTPQTRAVLALLTASEAEQAGDRDLAVSRLDAVATDGAVPEIYRQIAAFKALTLQADTMEAAQRRQQLEALAVPGSPIRLLAEEQLALMDVAAGDAEAAIARYQSILVDAEATSDLQQRAVQVIVSLGGAPDVANLTQPAN